MRISDWSSDVCSSDLRLGLAALQLSNQRGTAVLHIIDRRQFGDALVYRVGRERCSARAVAAGGIILGVAVGGHAVGGNAELVELLTRGEDSLPPPVPFVLHGNPRSEVRSVGKACVSQ